MTMSELEKLEAGLPYRFTDEAVNERKLQAVLGCQKAQQY
ncbi:maltose O-acetyltransferase [Streptococcus hyointestinalis]|uniref:Maltose O-acetyltransferase n=1 Tax=Streptococcus hyointestinalis TaxID=1337 RepID=A0A380K7J7_9STRE|nr:maltose O-acetyltransferase [Streptococcus hyointestinalis]